MNLSVIIINYNGAKFMSDCLNSVQKACVNLESEILVFDNNSTDGSVEIIKRDFPGIVLIESDVNLGFAKGNNLAIAKAKYDNLLLLNFDTILLDNLENAVSYLDDKKIGAITIKMLDSKRNWITSFGEFPNPFQLFRIGNHFDNESLISYNNREELFSVDWISGSFLMTRKECYLKVGGLDESYFMYVEDVDFSKKIANLGLDRVFLDSLSYVHFVGFNKERERLLIKGYQQYANNHFTGLSYLAARFGLLVNFWVKKFVKRSL